MYVRHSKLIKLHIHHIFELKLGFWEFVRQSGKFANLAMSMYGLQNFYCKMNVDIRCILFSFTSNKLSHISSHRLTFTSKSNAGVENRGLSFANK